MTFFDVFLWEDTLKVPFVSRTEHLFIFFCLFFGINLIRLVGRPRNAKTLVHVFYPHVDNINFRMTISDGHFTLRTNLKTIFSSCHDMS